MTRETRLARTSVLTLLLIGVLSPAPTFAAVLFDNSKADKVWDITLPSSIPLPGDTNGHYVNFFKGFQSLGNPSPIVGPENAWVTTATTTTARIKKAGNYTCDSMLVGTSGFAIFGPSYNINNTEYYPTDSTPSTSVGSDYCDYHFAGLGIPTGTPLTVAFLGTFSPHAIAGSDSNGGTSFDGFYGNPIPGGFAFQLCDIDGCSGGFSTTTTPTTTPSGPSSVMFLPGIESSRLYEMTPQGEDKHWEPNRNEDVEDLYLPRSGTEGPKEIYTKEKDVLDTLPNGVDVYKPFLDKIDKLKSDQIIKDWEPIAYDWRLTPDEILSKGHVIDGKIYYTGTNAATSTPYIIQELRRLASDSKSGKVTIVAHSNGGLIAKRLTQLLGETEASKLIDRVILVAVPQVGTPMAIAAGMHGYDQDIVKGAVLSKRNARTFASTSPMFYNLLPSQGFFTYVDNPVVAFKTVIPEWSSRYGQTIHSQETLDAFLTDSYGRVDSKSLDVDQPIQLDPILLAQANTLHSSIDNWTPPAGIEVIQIAGWGIPNTVSSVQYQDPFLGYGTRVVPEMRTTIDGDGTVVTPSALWTSGTVAKNYWVDLKTYNQERPITTLFGKFAFDHSRILATTPVNNFISDIVGSTTKAISSYQYLSTSVPTTNDTSLRYSLHSPLTLNLYDGLGNHTGVSTTTGEIEEQIPGTYYSELGDVKYLFTDATSPAHIKMTGYDSGVFTLNVDQLLGDTLLASTTFKDIPVTPTTNVNMDIVSDISTLSPMNVDLGNGITYSLLPKANDVVTIPKPKLFIVPTNKTMTFGSVIPALTATLSGFKTGDTAGSTVVGSASCTTTATATSGIGVYPITCTKGTLTSNKYDFATSSAGTLSIQYRFDGFLQPINDTAHQTGQTVSVFKAGSTVPVKLQLKKADGTVVQSINPPAWLTPQKGSAMSATVDESVYTYAGTSGTAFKWDTASGQYVYNWNTKGLTSGYWYKISVKLDDGTIQVVTVGLK